MTKKGFDSSLRDAQATEVKAISPEKFDLQQYVDYEAELLGKSRSFWQAKSGIAVYRRMRVAEVFAEGSGDMEASLRWQLGALKASMDYEADIPNFLEPWYGIGTAAAAYGIDYIWNPGQAPAVRHKYSSVADALNDTPQPIKDTPIGRHTLEMTEYFLEKTKGQVPMSLCDVQSPLNAAGNIVDVNAFMLEMLTMPDEVKKFLNILADLIIDFSHEQLKLIGDRIAWPGHGFASARCFEGFGMSDDNVVMFSPDMYEQLVKDSFVRCGEPFGGPVFHSCGNWADRIPMIKTIPGLKMVDGAFSEQTDPASNPAEPFAEGFAGTGIVLNARIVGQPEVISETLDKLWKPGMKLIVVTYCKSPEEQKQAYEAIKNRSAE